MTQTALAANPRVPYRLIHEDPDFLVVAKPAGVVSQPGEKHAHNSLLNGLAARFEQLKSLGGQRDFGLVHRLDKPTSGLLLVGLTERGYDGLRAQFEARTVEKAYLTLVHGRLTPAAGIERTPIREVRIDGRKRASVSPKRGAQAAETRFATIATGRRASLVECHPKTGRLHQVRAHLAHRKCPVVGDRDYGPRNALDKKFEAVAKRAIFLHAGQLVFAHPIRGSRLTVRSPLPDIHQAFLETLEIRCPRAWT